MTDVDATVENILKQAEHHRSAMNSRRAIGLKIIVGVVGFDLLVAKLSVDLSQKVVDHEQLAWIVRIILITAFCVAAGMLIQLEVRSRLDRYQYRLAERRVEAVHDGRDPVKAVPYEEPMFLAIRNAWATSWPLVGMMFLTTCLWWLVGLTPQ